MLYVDLAVAIFACLRLCVPRESLRTQESFFLRLPTRERKHMKILAVSAFALGLSLAAMTSSQAMPVVPLAPQAASTDTIPVAGGCGPGWHRGPYGGCRPMFNCPPGWHSGPFGRRCFRNGW
jgi:hypothetical protein